MNNLIKRNGDGGGKCEVIAYGCDTDSSKTFTAKYTGSIIVINHTDNGNGNGLAINGNAISAVSVVYAKGAGSNIVFVGSVNKGDTVSYTVTSAIGFVVLNCTGGALLAYNNCLYRTNLSCTLSNITKGKYILNFGSTQARIDGSSSISTDYINVSTSGTSATVLYQAVNNRNVTKLCLYKTTELSSITMNNSDASTNMNARMFTQIWF